MNPSQNPVSFNSAARSRWIRGLSFLESGDSAVRHSCAQGTVATIGNFDGVHRGHQEIFRRVVTSARELSLPSVALTFRPHPYLALRPDQPIELLTNYDERAQLILGRGVDWVVEEPFVSEFAKRSAEEFFSKIIIGALRAKRLVVGHDFGFGAGRSGTLDVLRALCQQSGVELQIVEPYSVPGSNPIVASSSKIRRFLKDGDLAQARELLGRSFSYQGQVISGDARGRNLGFPTANIQEPGKIQVPHGVYATRTWLYEQGDVVPRPFSGVTNIGIRPTFAEATPQVLIETHLLGQSLDLYGREIRVELLEKQRSEIKFSRVDALKAQIEQDCELARRISERHSFDVT